MEIFDIDRYRDGGTIIIHTDDGSFAYDNRINSETKGCLYSGYPKQDKSNILSSEISREYNFKIVNALLMERLKYKAE